MAFQPVAPQIVNTHLAAPQHVSLELRKAFKWDISASALLVRLVLIEHTTSWRHFYHFRISADNSNALLPSHFNSFVA